MRAVLAPVVLLAALTAGCASSGGGSDSGSSSDAAGSVADERLIDGGGDQPASAGARRTAVTTAAVISTGSVELHGEDVTDARFDVLAVVDRYAGEVAQEETATSDDGELAHARLVLRVPSADFGKAMTDLEGVAELDSSSRGSEDVTTQVIDNDVRIRAQARGLRRVEKLLDRAENLTEIVAIEATLTKRQANLDSLKSQQAYLADQTTLATITVNIEHRGPATGAEDDDSGFLAGLDTGWHGVTTFVGGVATTFGLLLPFALLFTLVGTPVWLASRAVRRRRTAALAVRSSGTDAA